MILAAIITEIAFQILYEVDQSWTVYALSSEIRALFWMMAAFSMASRLVVKTVILAVILQQLWTIALFHLYFTTGERLDFLFVPEVTMCALVFTWLAYRPYDAPAISCRVDEMGQAEVYVVFRKPSTAYFFDVVKSLFGLPARSVFIYCNNWLYGYHGGCKLYGKQPFDASRAQSGRYAIRLPVDSYSAEMALNNLVGAKYRALRNNCANTPHMILSTSKFCFAPGLLALKLTKGARSGRR